MPMANVYKSKSKATVCNGNNCVTVYGEAAKIVEGIVVSTITILAIALLFKALR